MAFLCCCLVSAQKPVEIDYAIRVAPAFSGSQIKFVHEALRAQDPQCLIWPDAPGQRIVVRMVVPLNTAELQQLIAPAGLQVVGVDLILPDDAGPRKAMIMASMGFPLFVDTGHPELDQSNYQAAKEAWINADPARYEELMRELNPAEQQVR